MIESCRRHSGPIIKPESSCYNTTHLQMPFAESTKLSVKRKAHFSCCLCHSIGVEVHHIIPQSEGGPDTEDNAAPLCPSCHETYGANPQKRKFIREARDFWYETCERRYQPDADLLQEMADRIQQTALQQDVAAAVVEIQDRINSVQEELRTKSIADHLLVRRQAVTDVGTQLALEMAKCRIRDLLVESHQILLEAVSTLAEIAEVAPELFVQQCKDLSSGPVSEDPEHRLLYHLLRQNICAEKLATAGAISSSVVSTLLELYDKDPRLPIPDLLNKLGSRIRSGQLDQSARISTCRDVADMSDLLKNSIQDRKPSQDE